MAARVAHVEPARAVAPRRQSGFTTTSVLAVFDETDEIRTFRMRRPEGFEFRAGQFLTVRVPVNGKPLARCYSISSSPEARGYLEISVKRQGIVSGALHAVVRPDSLLEVKGPGGAFAYPVGDDRPLVLLAGGVGITPLMSMLRHAVAADPTRPVTLALSVRDAREVPFGEELRLLARRNPQVQVAVAVTRGTPPKGCYAGRIDRRLLEHLVRDRARSLFYLCGPLPMIDSLKAELAALGVPALQVRSEAFEAAVASSRAASSPVPAEASAPASEQPLVPSAPAPTLCQLRFARSGRTASGSTGQTLLETAESVGVDIPSSCRAGVCGTCRTRLIDGDVDCDADALDPREREEGWILPCVSWARGPSTVDA